VKEQEGTLGEGRDYLIMIVLIGLTNFVYYTLTEKKVKETV
jgi:hypothetical protein